MQARGRLAIALVAYVGLMISSAVLVDTARTVSISYHPGYLVSVHHARTFDGLGFDYLVAMAEDVAGAPAGCVPAVVVGHGLGNTKEDALRRGIHFAKHGFVVLIPDFRGHGSHEGTIRLDVEWRDVGTMLDDVLASPAFSMINASAIGTWGHSNGGFQALMLAIHDPRIVTCVASSGAYNTSELLSRDDSRLHLIGVPFDPRDAEQVRIRSPVALATPGNPKNLMLFAGDADDNVPHVHSDQLDAVVNPAGNRTDYNYTLYPGEGHGIGNKQEVIQRSIAWLALHLTGEVLDPATIDLFEEPFAKRAYVDPFKVASVLVAAATVPLAFLLERGAVTAWDRTALARARSRVLPPGRSIVERVSSAGVPGGGSLAANGLASWRAPVAIMLAWVGAHALPGLAIAASGYLVSRVLAFLLLPPAAMLAYLLVDRAVVHARPGRPPVATTGTRGTLVSRGSYTIDLALAVLVVVPAWLLQLLLFGAMASGTLAHVSLVGNYFDIFPRPPVSIALLARALTFAIGITCHAWAGRWVASFATRGKYNDTASLVPVGTRARPLLQVLAWLFMAVLHALASALLALLGAALFLAPMTNPLLTEVDFTMQLNDALLVGFALVVFIATLLQGVIEKFTGSYSKACIIVALVLLGLFASIG